MGCNSEVLHIVALDASAVRVTGRIDSASQPCPLLQITVQFPGGDRSANATIIGDDWTADFSAIPPGQVKDWCNHSKHPGPLTVVMHCLDNGHTLCEQTDAQPLTCCPRILNLGFTNGDCQDTEDGTFRWVTWRLKVEWPPDWTQQLDVRLAVWRTSNSGLRSESTVTALPDDALTVYPVPLLLRADRDYVGDITCLSPQTCSDAPQAIAGFHVPACDCAEPAPPETFFTLRDSSGQTIANSNEICVASDFVTVHAASGPVVWSASADGLQITPSVIDAQTVRIDLPADGTRVLVTALLSNGDCVHAISISAQRCPLPPPACTPVPADYALQVFDNNNQPVADGQCVPGNSARVVAPDHEGPVQWTVDGSAAAADATNPRAVTVALNADAPRTVTATVGIDKCRQDVSVTLTRCADPVSGNGSPPRFSWCMLMLIIALGLLFAGSLMFTFGFAVVNAWPCFIWAGNAAAAPTGGLSILLAVLIYAFCFELAVVGAICMIVGLILLLLWVYYCGGCDGIRSRLSFCDMLNTCEWLLMLGSTLVLVIEGAMLALSAVASGVCSVVLVPGAGGVVLSPIGLGTAAVIWLIDAGVLGLANFIVYWFGNAMGCFNSWPSFVPLPRLPANWLVGLRCLDE